MKAVICLAFTIFICFAVHIPNAFSQDECPQNIVDIKKDSRFRNVVFDNLDVYTLSSGLWCQYYKNGKLEYEIPPLETGISRKYYESGKLQSEWQVKEGKQDGLTRRYYENGALHQELTFKNDRIEGVLEVYRSNGKMFATITYEKGSPVSGVCHHTNGKTSPLTNAELTNFENGLDITCD